MKKLLYLLLLTPIIYLTSCSSSTNELTPETQSESDLVGIWERFSLRYNTYDLVWVDDWYEDMDGDGIEELVMEAHWEDHDHQSFDLIGSEMASYYNYDRYVIELHSDNTYDEYIYYADLALQNTGNWDVELVSECDSCEVSEILIIDENWYPLQKTNENAYELSIDITYFPPTNSSSGIHVSDMYEKYVRIEDIE